MKKQEKPSQGLKDRMDDFDFKVVKKSSGKKKEK